MVQITTVSINGSSKATIPSVTGSFVFTAECAMAAEPTPASLEKAALLKPCTNTPTKPPLAASLEKAESKIKASTSNT